MNERKRLRWGRWLAGLITLTGLVGLTAYTFRGRGIRSELAAVVAELDASDPGWRLDDILREFRREGVQPNSVPRIVAVAAAMPSNLRGAAIAPLKELRANARLDPGRQAILDRLLAGMPRDAARDLIRFPDGRFELTVHDFEPRTKDLIQAAAVPTLLRLDALDRALASRADEALESVRACLNVARPLSADPTMQGQLTRLGIVTLAFEAVERTLALGEASEKGLADLTQAIHLASDSDGLTRMVRVERAMVHAYMSEVGQGWRDPVDVGEWLAIPKLSFFAQGGPLVRQEILRREHVAVLRLLTWMVEATRLPTADQFAAERRIAAQRRTASGLLVPTVYINFEKHLAEARTHRCAAEAMMALIAVERYRLSHGKWPAAVPEGRPPDPIDGKPLRFKRTADGVVVYSIGNDRTDDGGDVDGKKDVGYRLWDVGKRRAQP